MTDAIFTDPCDIFDRDYLIQNFRDFPGLLKELLEVYTPDALLLSQEIAAACSLADASLAAVAAHKLKGASASVGAVRVRNTAEKIEKTVLAGDVPAAVELLPTLAAEIEAMTREVPVLMSEDADGRVDACDGPELKDDL